MRYTVELNKEDISAEKAEEKLRKLIAPVKVVRVFGRGRYASIDVSESELAHLHKRIGSEVTFQRYVEATPFSK